MRLSGLEHHPLSVLFLRVLLASVSRPDGLYQVFGDEMVGVQQRN